MKREEKKWQISSTDSSRFTKDEIIINNSFPSGFEVVRGRGEYWGKKKRKKLIALRPACVTNRPNGEIIHEQRPYAREDHSGSVSIGVGFHPTARPIIHSSDCLY